LYAVGLKAGGINLWVYNYWILAKLVAHLSGLLHPVFHFSVFPLRRVPPLLGYRIQK